MSRKHLTPPLPFKHSTSRRFGEMSEIFYIVLPLIIETTNDMKDLSEEMIYNQMPAHYLLCYNADCPKGGNCLHRLGAIHGKPADKVVQAVNPKLCCGDNCPYYKPMKSVSMAYGMTHLYDKVLAKDISSLRNTIIQHFGNGSYYLRRNGRHPISPEEQAWIQNLFCKYGYTDAPQFDSYKSEVGW